MPTLASRGGGPTSGTPESCVCVTPGYLRGKFGRGRALLCVRKLGAGAQSGVPVPSPGMREFLHVALALWGRQWGPPVEASSGDVWLPHPQGPCGWRCGHQGLPPGQRWGWGVLLGILSHLLGAHCLGSGGASLGFP